MAPKSSFAALVLVAFSLQPQVVRAQSADIDQRRTVGIDLTPKIDSSQVLRLEDPDGKFVDVTPAAITKSKEIILLSVKRTGYFEIPSILPKAKPIKIHFGSKNPDTGWGLQLARLNPKGGKAEVTMKMSFSMHPVEEFEPYPDAKVPKAEKAADGTYTLTLPKPLAPGVYAIVGFNGATGTYATNWSKHDGAAWIFEVESSPVQPVLPAH